MRGCVGEHQSYFGKPCAPLQSEFTRSQAETILTTPFRNIDDKHLLPERQAAFFDAFRAQISDQLHPLHTQKQGHIEVSTEKLSRMQYRIKICRTPNSAAYKVHVLGCECQFGYPRFARKFGADRFVRATIEGIPRDSVGDCHKETQPFYWLGRKWVCMWSRVDQQKRSKCGKAVEEQGPPKTTHIFFAERLCTGDEEYLCENLSAPTNNLSGSESLRQITVDEVLRSHIPESVISTCPPSCQQHFQITVNEVLRSHIPESVISTCPPSC